MATEAKQREVSVIHVPASAEAERGWAGKNPAGVWLSGNLKKKGHGGFGMKQWKEYFFVLYREKRELRYYKRAVRESLHLQRDCRSSSRPTCACRFEPSGAIAVSACPSRSTVCSPWTVLSTFATCTRGSSAVRRRAWARSQVCVAVLTMYDGAPGTRFDLIIRSMGDSHYPGEFNEQFEKPWFQFKERVFRLLAPDASVRWALRNCHTRLVHSRQFGCDVWCVAVQGVVVGHTACHEARCGTPRGYFGAGEPETAGVAHWHVPRRPHLDRATWPCNSDDVATVAAVGSGYGFRRVRWQGCGSRQVASVDFVRGVSNGSWALKATAAP